MPKNYDPRTQPYVSISQMVGRYGTSDSNLFDITVVEELINIGSDNKRYPAREGSGSFNRVISKTEFDNNDFQLINPGTAEDLTPEIATSLGFASNEMTFRQFYILLTSFLRHFQLERDNVGDGFGGGESNE